MFHRFARTGGLLAALAAASLPVTSLATPLATFAQDPDSNIAMSAQATLLVVDQSGNVLGQLVPVPTSTNAIREMAERGKALLEAPAYSAPDTRWHPRQAESPAFWDQFNRNFTSAY